MRFKEYCQVCELALMVEEMGQDQDWGPAARSQWSKLDQPGEPKQQLRLHRAISELVKKYSDSKTFAAALRKHLMEVEITINFDPCRKNREGLTSGQGIAKSGEYGSYHTTGVTNAVDKFQGGRESTWGFEIDDVDINDRPKYAAINWGRRPHGADSDYGNAVWVLNPAAVLNRSTLVAYDSLDVRGAGPSKAPDAISNVAGTVNNPLEMLLAHTAGLREVVLPALVDCGVPAEEAKAVQKFALSNSLMSGNYSEVMIWGRLRLNGQTVRELRLQHMKCPEAVQALKQFCQGAGIKVVDYDEDDEGYWAALKQSNQRSNDGYERWRYDGEWAGYDPSQDNPAKPPQPGERVLVNWDGAKKWYTLTRSVRGEYWFAKPDLAQDPRTWYDHGDNVEIINVRRERDGSLHADYHYDP